MQVSAERDMPWVISLVSNWTGLSSEAGLVIHEEWGGGGCPEKQLTHPTSGFKDRRVIFVVMTLIGWFDQSHDRFDWCCSSLAASCLHDRVIDYFPARICNVLECALNGSFGSPYPIPMQCCFICGKKPF